jgi:hypothetical protein
MSAPSITMTSSLAPESEPVADGELLSAMKSFQGEAVMHTDGENVEAFLTLRTHAVVEASA